MTTATTPIVDNATVRQIISNMYGDNFGSHPGCRIKQSNTASAQTARIEITFTRCWTYLDGIFESTFGHMHDATCTYDWYGDLNENRHRFVMTVEITCDDSDPVYKIRVTHYWRPVFSWWGHICAHFNAKWYLLPWRVLTLLLSDFQTGLKCQSMSMGKFSTHVDALEAVRVPVLDAMPVELRDMLTS